MNPARALARGLSAVGGALEALGGQPVTYAQGGTAHTIVAAIRGLTAVELEAAAMQGDFLAVIRADDLRAAFGAAATPLRYDRITTGEGVVYAVETWRAAPAAGDPVFFKLGLRGGRQ